MTNVLSENTSRKTEQLKAIIVNPYISQSHYEITEVEEGYTFTTVNDEEYFIYFLPTGELFSGTGFDVYSFNIERIKKSNSLKRKHDDLGRTIAYILDLFFKKQQNAIITQCETEDGCQDARARLFERWFNRYNSQGLIDKISEKVEFTDDYMTVFSIYFNPNSPDIELLKNSFYEYVSYSK